MLQQPFVCQRDGGGGIHRQGRWAGVLPMVGCGYPAERCVPGVDGGTCVNADVERIE